ncbi:transcriptional adapter 3-related [Anaeramoeba flamelloides]|uniref:Transcriptional adapter 3-related n=1 Tax=Anaeramoeba flamelloides TaxID=1746091 RepID=A0ABQ8Z6N4_9EUKA|nr:transcriptional adapter 3-related [Anaeramoeba flamelloides]
MSHYQKKKRNSQQFDHNKEAQKRNFKLSDFWNKETFNENLSIFKRAREKVGEDYTLSELLNHLDSFENMIYESDKTKSQITNSKRGVEIAIEDRKVLLGTPREKTSKEANTEISSNEIDTHNLTESKKGTKRRRKEKNKRYKDSHPNKSKKKNKNRNRNPNKNSSEDPSSDTIKNKTAGKNNLKEKFHSSKRNREGGLSKSQKLKSKYRTNRNRNKQKKKRSTKKKKKRNRHHRSSREKSTSSELSSNGLEEDDQNEDQNLNRHNGDSDDDGDDLTDLGDQEIRHKNKKNTSLQRGRENRKRKFSRSSRVRKHKRKKRKSKYKDRKKNDHQNSVNGSDDSGSYDNGDGDGGGDNDNGLGSGENDYEYKPRGYSSNSSNDSSNTDQKKPRYNSRNHSETSNEDEKKSYRKQKRKKKRKSRYYSSFLLPKKNIKKIDSLTSKITFTDSENSESDTSEISDDSDFLDPNMDPDIVWSVMEPYFRKIAQSDRKLLKISEIEKEGLTKIPSLGKHYKKTGIDLEKYSQKHSRKKKKEKHHSTNLALPKKKKNLQEIKRNSKEETNINEDNQFMGLIKKHKAIQDLGFSIPENFQQEHDLLHRVLGALIELPIEGGNDDYENEYYDDEDHNNSYTNKNDTNKERRIKLEKQMNNKRFYHQKNTPNNERGMGRRNASSMPTTPQPTINLSEKTKIELQLVGLLENKKDINLSNREDDEVCRRIRELQNLLKKLVKKNNETKVWLKQRAYTVTKEENARKKRMEKHKIQEKEYLNWIKKNKKELKKKKKNN